MEQDTLEWVREAAASLPQVPTQLAVLHIPPPQVSWLPGAGAAEGPRSPPRLPGFKAAPTAGCPASHTALPHERGQVMEAWANGSARGFKGEDSCCPAADSGAFAALR